MALNTPTNDIYRDKQGHKAACRMYFIAIVQAVNSLASWFHFQRQQSSKMVTIDYRFTFLIAFKTWSIALIISPMYSFVPRELSCFYKICLQITEKQPIPKAWTRCRHSAYNCSYCSPVSLRLQRQFIGKRKAFYNCSEKAFRSVTFFPWSTFAYVRLSRNIFETASLFKNEVRKFIAVALIA